MRLIIAHLLHGRHVIELLSSPLHIMGKPNKVRTASKSNEGDDIRTIVIEAMTNQQVINAIAEKVDEAIVDTFEQRISIGVYVNRICESMALK